MLVDLLALPSAAPRLQALALAVLNVVETSRSDAHTHSLVRPPSTKHWFAESAKFYLYMLALTLKLASASVLDNSK